AIEHLPPRSHSRAYTRRVSLQSCGQSSNSGASAVGWPQSSLDYGGPLCSPWRPNDQFSRCRERLPTRKRLSGPRSAAARARHNHHALTAILSTQLSDHTATLIEIDIDVVVALAGIVLVVVRLRLHARSLVWRPVVRGCRSLRICEAGIARQDRVNLILR